jgi:hypothetical protein
MSLIKNKSNLYLVLRHDFSGSDVVVAACKTPERADELVGEYSQLFVDKGISPDESYFYSSLVIFYDN